MSQELTRLPGPNPQRPPWVLGVMGDSVHPGAQDPEAQAGPDTWITEIRTYLKDNILPDDMASANRIAHLAKRYTLVEGDCHTPVLRNRTEASIRVPRMFKSHTWQQYDEQMKCYE
jgi:hypothetical protein